MVHLSQGGTDLKEKLYPSSRKPPRFSEDFILARSKREALFAPGILECEREALAQALGTFPPPPLRPVFGRNPFSLQGSCRSDF